MLAETRIFTRRDIINEPDTFLSFQGNAVINENVMDVMDKLSYSNEPQDMAMMKKMIGAGAVPRYPVGWARDLVEFAHDKVIVHPHQSHWNHVNNLHDMTYNRLAADLFVEKTYTVASFPKKALQYPDAVTEEYTNNLLVSIRNKDILTLMPTKSDAIIKSMELVRDSIIVSIATNVDIGDQIMPAIPSPRLVYRLFRLAYAYRNQDACIHLHNILAEFPEVDEETEGLINRLMHTMGQACDEM